MNKQTSILVAFAFAFFVAFALTANEILSNDNLKTEINTSDKSTKTTCSSKMLSNGERFYLKTGSGSLEAEKLSDINY